MLPIRSDLAAFGNKLKWRASLHGNGEKRCFLMRKRKLPTPHHNGTVDGELKGWLAGLSSTVLKAASNALAHARSTGRYAICPPMVKRGLLLLREGPWSIVQADKDHATVFIHKSLMQEV